MPRISRRKYAEVLKCLKAAIKNEKLSWVQRLRAVELLMCVYGVSLPENDPRIRRSVKTMVEERAGERVLNNQIKEAVQERVREEAGRAEEDKMSAALRDFLSGGGDGKNE
jgi:hypothetical protein